MVTSVANVDVYLECGTKRTFAGALEWPGWCRHGSNEDEARAALFAYGPKYAKVLAGTRLGFTAPATLSQLAVVERLPGTAATDFGVISVPPAIDRNPCEPADVKRFEKILRSGWRGFDKAVSSARGKRLATGPRGGGRSLEGIVEHVTGADASYLAAVGWKAPKTANSAQRLTLLREAILAALDASASGKIPPTGPRGGARWTARYFVRRVAWHVISHAWEIERRLAP